MSGNNEGTVPPLLKKLRKEWRDNGAVKVALRLIDKDQASRLSGKHVRGDQKGIPFTIRKVRNAVLVASGLRGDDLLVVL